MARRQRISSLVAVAALGALGGCSGGSSGGGGVPAGGDGLDTLAGAPEASRFLTRATFGATADEIESLVALGNTAWIDQQMAVAPTLLRPELEALGCFTELPGVDDCPETDEEIGQLHISRTDLWWQQVLTAPDQLRQRVAFALSEIFVVSARSDFLFATPLLLADYYDTLALGAFGTYRELLEDVTLHPAMGVYLSMVKNQKPNELLGFRPDENYAREIMQLFSIGLEMLEADGTTTLDGNGDPIPTYDQDVIKGMAHAFTGWNFAGTEASNIWEWLGAWPELGPMEAWEDYHDSEPKTLVTWYAAPAGQTAEQELELVLDLLDAHPNVGPFIGKQLIQRLVTSNPSPEYVARISAVWADDGQGVRGNLGAVVRAILTDEEAIGGYDAAPTTFGKVREPMLRLTAMLRAFDAEPQNGASGLEWAEWAFGQAPLSAPSVFNFFRPEFAPAGPIVDAGLLAPEMEITTHTYINRGANVLAWLAFEHYVGTDCDDCAAPLMDFAEAAALAADPPALVDHLDVLLTGGTMSSGARDALIAYVASYPLETPWDGAPTGYGRLREALHLISVSPEFAVQK